MANKYIKSKKVDKCENCPYLNMPGVDTKFFCAESDGWQDIKDETIIPDWCPLPDDRRSKEE